MAQRDTKHTGKDNKGNPSAQPGQDKASIKDVKKSKEEIEREEELRDRYTDEEGNPDQDSVPVKNPNRNTDKTKIDQPGYGGGTK